MREESIFMAALDKVGAEERAAYLDQACAGDAELRARLQALLQSHEGAGSFLAEPMLQANDLGEQTPAERPGAEEIGTFIGPYKLLQQIGAGGMGVVWMAEQQQPVRRKVAIKVIKAGMDTAQVVARFEAERQALALMDHPNIAKVLDAGATNAGRPYFVMELVKGVPITKYCDEHQLTPRQRLELFVPVCQAIQHAHQKGIIHRDLKPSNVFVASYDGKPVPKVIDFGVAKAMGQQLTERTLFTGFGGIVGTLEYMSPEQAEFNALDVDTRSDVYSLGVLMYELLTGTTPLTRERLKEAALDEVLRFIREEEPPKPSTRLSDSKETLPTIAAQRKLEPLGLTREVRGELDWIVMKALEKDRTRRYDTAIGLARDIERYLADETVEACPPSVRYRLHKFVRKHRHMLATVAAFAVLLVSGAVLSLSLAVRAAHAESDAVTAWDAEIVARKGTERERDRALAAEKLAKSSERLAQERLKDAILQTQRADQEAARATAAEKLAQVRLKDAILQQLRADQEAAIASAVKDLLLHDLLDQVNVAHQIADEHRRDADVKVRTLLDRAAKAIDSKFAHQPLTEAAIRYTIGNAYLALGRTVEAKLHLDRSVQLHTTHLGADHHDTLRGRNSIAEVLRIQGKHVQAGANFRQVAQACEIRLREDHELTLEVKHNLARLYKQEGHYDKSEMLCREVLQVRIAKLGADHDRTLSSKHLLAALLQFQGKFDQAETIIHETLQVSTAKLGADHPRVLAIRSDIIWFNESRGNLGKAETMCQELVDAYASLMGPEHPLTLTTKNNLARIWLAQRKYARAEEALKEMLQGQIERQGERHLDALITKINLARAYYTQRKFASAETLLKESLETCIAELGADHSLTLSCKGHLGGMYLEQQKFEQAEALFHEMLKMQHANLGADHHKTMTTAGNLAAAYFNQKKFHLAEPLFQDALKAYRARLGSDHAGTQNMMNSLAGTYFLQGKFDRAEPLLREMLAYYKAKDGGESDRVADTLSKLGHCTLKQQKYADAEAVLRECLAIRVRKQPDAWNVFNTRAQIGTALLGQKKYADAEPLLLQGYEGMKEREAKIPPPSRRYLTEAVNSLVDLYDAWGQNDKAAEWRKIAAARKKALP